MAWEEDGQAHSEGFLIKPSRGWTSWSSQSQALHGITRTHLQDKGLPVDQAAQCVMKRLATADGIHCDAPEWDGQWLDALLRAGGIDNAARTATVARVEHAVEAWGMACRPLLSLLPKSAGGRLRMEAWVKATASALVRKAIAAEKRRIRTRHRAVADAEGLLWILKEIRHQAQATATAWASNPAALLEEQSLAE